MSNEEVRDAVQVAIEVLGKIRILQIHVLSEELMPDTSMPYVTDARTAIANLRNFRLEEIRNALAGIDSPLDAAIVPFPASSAFDAVVRVALNLGPCLDILEPHLRTYVAPVAREVIPAVIDTAESRQSWDHEKWEYYRMLLRDVRETIGKLDVQALIARLKRELGRQQQTARFMQVGDELQAERKLRARKAPSTKGDGGGTTTTETVPGRLGDAKNWLVRIRPLAKAVGWEGAGWLADLKRNAGDPVWVAPACAPWFRVEALLAAARRVAPEKVNTTNPEAVPIGPYLRKHLQPPDFKPAWAHRATIRPKI